jgi:hypothetical protein
LQQVLKNKKSGPYRAHFRFPLPARAAGTRKCVAVVAEAGAGVKETLRHGSGSPRGVAAALEPGRKVSNSRAAAKPVKKAITQTVQKMGLLGLQFEEA